MTTRLLVHRSDGLWVVDDGWKSLCRTSIIGFCLSRDGSRVAVLTPLGVLTGIDLIDVETGRRREIGRLRGRVLDPQWHPGGKRLGAISQSDDGDSKIVVLDVDTGQTTTLPSFPERYNLGQLEWSPDGQMLAVEGQPLDHLRGMSVFLVTPNSDSPRLIAPAGSPEPKATCGRFSPDGRTLAYSYTDHSVLESEIWVAPLKGGRPRRVCAGGYDDPRWSLDGRQLLIAAHLSPCQARLGVVDVQSGDVSLISDAMGQLKPVLLTGSEALFIRQDCADQDEIATSSGQLLRWNFTTDDETMVSEDVLHAVAVG